MIWPERLLTTPPMVHIPDGYTIRTYNPGDEARFYEVMARAGWPGWNDKKLQPWLSRILPDGWFMIIDETSEQIVATAMSLHITVAFCESRFASQVVVERGIRADTAHLSQVLATQRGNRTKCTNS